MPRDRDWVDYANLASNVAQNFQLEGINSKMRQLGELELLKQYREQQESAVAHCEDILREAVFFYTEQLRDVKELANKNPQQAYIRANHLKGTYERMPQFSSSGFRKFEDKERLANVQRTCDRLIRECAARLEPDAPEIKDSDTMLDELAKAGYTFSVKKHSGNVEVIGKVPIPTTPKGRDEAMKYLGLEMDESVQYRSTPTARPVRMNVGHVL